ncbi:MAG: ABC transporter permease subunit [Candidatus Hodarchaeales archaeon]|jgi:ABC-2 type transport system permease protein
MNSFIVQLKNDLYDDKFKFLLLTVLFTALSITTILGTFYIDEIMSLLGFSDFPVLFDPSAKVAFLDFFGDQVLFGLLIMSLGSMGVLASDIESGAISFSLSRPISRSHYTLSKVLSRVLALTVPFIISSVIGWLYLGLMFDLLPFEILLGSLIPLVALYLYMGFLTSFISSRASAINAGFITIAILIIQFTLSAFEPLELLSPFALSSFWTSILTNPLFEWNVNIFGKLFFLLLWVILPLIGTVYSMRKRDI